MAPTLKPTPTNTKKSVSFAPTHHVASIVDSPLDADLEANAPDVLRDEGLSGLPAAQLRRVSTTPRTRRSAFAVLSLAAIARS